MQAWDWKECRTWHELFDHLCVRAGYDDNALLANAYLQHAGANGHDNLGAILKNIRNWRQGRHLPLRRNVVALAEILGLNNEPELRERWFSLYRIARGEPAPESAPPTAEASAPTQRALQPWLWAAVAATLAIAAPTGSYLYRWWQFEHLPQIGYDARVRMLVGESRLIHGDRTECNLPPPTYAEVSHRIPASRLGVFSDGGVARKMDNSCGREIAVRAARFTARTTGEEELRLFDDFIKLEVYDAFIPAS